MHIQDGGNVFTMPLIDLRYCSDPLDCEILVEALLFNNRLANTTSMRLLQPTPFLPFVQDATRETLTPAINLGSGLSKRNYLHLLHARMVMFTDEWGQWVPSLGHDEHDAKGVGGSGGYAFEGS